MSPFFYGGATHLHSAEPTVLHLQGPVGEFIDSFVVRYNNDTAFLVENASAHKAYDVPPGVSIERGCGFVHNQDVWLAHHGSGNRHALLLSSAQFPRTEFCPWLQAHDVQILD